MRFKHIIVHDDFLKDAKAIKDVHPEFGRDLKKMRKSLVANPGINNPNSEDLGGGLFKFYLEITGKPASKSFGARGIYLLITQDSEIWYLMCYDKSDQLDITPSEKKAMKKLVQEIKSLRRVDRLSKFSSKSLGRK